MSEAYCSCGFSWQVPCPVRGAHPHEVVSMLRQAVAADGLSIAVPVPAVPHRPTGEGPCVEAWAMTYLYDYGDLAAAVVSTPRHVRGHIVPADVLATSGGWEVTGSVLASWGRVVGLHARPIDAFDRQVEVTYLDPVRHDMRTVAQQLADLCAEHGELGSALLLDVHRPAQPRTVATWRVDLPDAIAGVRAALRVAA